MLLLWCRLKINQGKWQFITDKLTTHIYCQQKQLIYKLNFMIWPIILP